jgi:hypothetical protein
MKLLFQFLTSCKRDILGGRVLGQLIFLAVEVCFVQNRQKDSDRQMVIRMVELRQTDRRVGAGRLLNIVTDRDK